MYRNLLSKLEILGVKGVDTLPLLWLNIHIFRELFPVNCDGDNELSYF